MVGLLVTSCIMAAILNVALHGYGSDAAAWVQAGGSIAAIYGAAWISCAEGRRQRRARRREREEVAWGVRFALAQAKTECSTIAWEIAGPEAKPLPSDRRHWRLRTQVSRRSLEHCADRFDHIHPAIMHVANNAVALLDQLDGDLDEVYSHLGAGEELPERLVSDIRWYSAYFETLIEMLDDRMRGVILALDGNEDVMSEDYNPWRVPTGQPPG